MEDNACLKGATEREKTNREWELYHLLCESLSAEDKRRFCEYANLS